MADFSMKAHDLLPVIEASLSQGDQPLDLSTATAVRFIMRPAAGGALKVNSPAVVVDAAAGVVRYDWVTGDTDTPGSYQAEWEITFPSGPQTAPTMTYHSIDILADLDGA